jgi:SpoVK/Ycf46/Vps4 family AAA+-type ATPase
VLGHRIEDSQSWDDIVLPADTFESVREMLARVRHRHRVLDQWGFRTKLSKGLGVAALFHGPPGTGKTMIASLIARELGQELYQVDLSRMVSKWIGETEKNLARVFDAAVGATVMLLFDEADSLFSKRTEVSSSNDRHANAEVNYLLQRVERFEGVCILTTNFERSIDAAFKRRLAFRIEFPMPDEKERAELWRRMVPRSASVGNDVDYRSLARSYELAGGNIRNALLRAAFLAADQGQSITMDILQRAVKLEYRDAGKLAATGSIS